MTESYTEDATDAESSEHQHSARRIELSLVLEFDPEMFLDENDDVNEDGMLREALEYAAEASCGEFDTEISLADEVDE